MMKQKFDTATYKISKTITQFYSTSFSLGTGLLHQKIRNNIYAIYGFVRFADEIVDSFLEYDRRYLLNDFIKEYKKSLENKISLNPVLNAFQQVVHKYKLYNLVESFLGSMQKDLEKNNYENEKEYTDYIYGSADVVGLMCLKIFVEGDEKKYENLKIYAKKLGSAFQKVNFLRDLNSDMNRLNRSYFPNLQSKNLNETIKKEIIQDIEKDFQMGLRGIKKLPNTCKLGVFLAYRYYKYLLKKLAKKSPEKIMKERIRLSNGFKSYVALKSYVRYKINYM